MFSIKRLLPQDKKFYALIQELTTQAVISARNLRALVDSKTPEERKAAATAIGETKEAAKRASLATTKELCRTFITPFDREDIQDIAATLYKIPKTIEKVGEYVMAHQLDRIDDLGPQSDVILREAEAMESMVHALVQGGKHEHIVKQAALLDRLETDGDEILRTLLANLFNNTTNVRELIIHKDLYDLLERVIDRYRDVASISMQIALKHS